MWKNRKLLSETHSLDLSEASQGKASSEVNRILFDNAIGSTSFEVHVTSLGANTACDEVSQVTHKTSVMA